MSLIHIDNLCKEFKVINRREGLGGAFKDLFAPEHKIVKAVSEISFDIELYLDIFSLFSNAKSPKKFIQNILDMNGST